MLNAQQLRSTELLWNTAPRSRPGPKAALTTDGIARAAIAIADAEGLAAVSMKRIADRFGFTTMSLYRYVPGKSELVDLMFDTAMGSAPDLDVVPGGWRPKLEVWAREIWSLVLEHPWALEVLTRLRLPGPNELSWMECGVRALGETGLTGAALLDALFVIVGQVRIAAQYAVVVPQTRNGMTTEQWAAGLGALLHEHGGEFPAVMTATSAGAFDHAGDGLAFGLRCVLDGIDLLAAERASPR